MQYHCINFQQSKTTGFSHWLRWLTVVSNCGIFCISLRSSVSCKRILACLHKNSNWCRLLYSLLKRPSQDRFISDFFHLLARICSSDTIANCSHISELTLPLPCSTLTPDAPKSYYQSAHHVIDLFMSYSLLCEDDLPLWYTSSFNPHLLQTSRDYGTTSTTGIQNLLMPYTFVNFVEVCRCNYSWPRHWEISLSNDGVAGEMTVWPNWR